MRTTHNGRLALLPDGHIGGSPSLDAIKACPWFWVSSKAAWIFRPEWVGKFINGRSPEWIEEQAA